MIDSGEVIELLGRPLPWTSDEINAAHRIINQLENRLAASRTRARQLRTQEDTGPGRMDQALTEYIEDGVTKVEHPA